jgi:hypothetical protein
MQWLTRHSDIYKRPVIPIDLRRDDWVVAYNVLRERSGWPRPWSPIIWWTP